MMKKENGFDDGLCHDTDSGICGGNPGESEDVSKERDFGKEFKEGPWRI